MSGDRGRSDLGELEVLVEATYAALVEVGRPDLANLVCFYVDDDGTKYLEPLDDVDADELELMLRAERLAHEVATR